jgi:RHS repeat-associated protein
VPLRSKHNFHTRYTGRENDDTGVYFYRNRYYNPTFQRFISQDPIGMGGGINEYAYGGNNPIGFTDPLGTDARGAGWGSSGGGGGLSLAGFGGSGGGDDPNQAGNAPNNGRQPNEITCGTALPNGRTVGSYVNQLSNQINNSGSQIISTPYGPAPVYTPGLSPLSIPGAVYSGTNFRGMFGQGAGYTTNAFLGDAGNFAYAAVSANIGVPYLATELAAAGYSWTHHSPSDWVGPYGMDPSATVQIPAGYGASCKGY